MGAKHRGPHIDVMGARLYIRGNFMIVILTGSAQFSGMIVFGVSALRIISCEKQANEQGLGWIATAGLVLLAFLIMLPFAGQSVASSAVSHAEMEMMLAPRGAMKLPSLADSGSHKHHKVSKTGQTSTSKIPAFCAISGHVDHGTHICCFQSTSADQTILRRDRSVIEKPVVTNFLPVQYGSSGDGEQGVLAIGFNNSRLSDPQLMGLVGAAAEFLRTQRLLT